MHTHVTEKPTVSFQHIRKSYGDQLVLQDVDFDIHPGRVHALLGRNGAGKSTLLSILLGLLAADSGAIAIAGESWSPHHLRSIGASINGPAVYEHLSARANVTIHCHLLDLPVQEADRVLAIVGLQDTGRKKAKSFSTGMRARLALAQAILGDPEILVLDEPQNGLDPQGIIDLRRLLREWAGKGRTVVVSSHQLGEVVHLADDVTILANGEIGFSGPLDQLAPDGQLESAYLRLTEEGGFDV